MKTNDKKTHKVYLRNLNLWVDVTYQEYLDFYREIWAFRQKAQYHKLCNCPQNRAWLCDMDCCTCTFQTNTRDYSLDYIGEDFTGNDLPQASVFRSGAPDIQKIIEDAELLKTLFLKLGELTCEERQICELLLAGKTEREIAKIMGFKNQSAVNYRKNNAFKFLKEVLKDYR